MTEASSQDDLTSRANRRIGEVLKGKYRLDRVLGIGGMAVVYAATHRNQKRVAVKMLHLELSFANNVRARFVREGYVANTVDHPGALAVLDDDVAEDGAAFLVMELLDGKALDTISEARGGGLPPHVVLAVGEQMLDVLAKAHEKSIVHRDVKPANVFVTRDGTVKVLDFGIARLRDAAPHDATSTGVVMGTPAYMPPEQAYGRTHEIDGQSDVWAAGATLFHLLTGTNVHGSGTASEILIRAATVRATSLSSVRPDLDPRVAAIVDRALAFEKAARWPSAAAMRDAIRELVREGYASSTSAKDALVQLLVECGDAAPLPRLAVATAETVSAPEGSIPSRKDFPLLQPVDQTRALPVVDGTGEAVTAGPMTRSSVTDAPRDRSTQLVRAALAGVGLAIAVAFAGVWALGPTRPPSSFASRAPSTAERVAPSAPSTVTPPTVTARVAPPVVSAPSAAAPTPASALPPASAPAPVAPAPLATKVAASPSRAAAPSSNASRPATSPRATKASDDDLFHP